MKSDINTCKAVTILGELRPGHHQLSPKHRRLARLRTFSSPYIDPDSSIFLRFRVGIDRRPCVGAVACLWPKTSQNIFRVLSRMFLDPGRVWGLWRRYTHQCGKPRCQDHSRSYSRLWATRWWVVGGVKQFPWKGYNKPCAQR